MSVGVALLLCDNIGEARVLANELDALNQTRKEIEQGMQAEALTRSVSSWSAAPIPCPAGWRCTIRNGIKGESAFSPRGLRSASIARLSLLRLPATARLKGSGRSIQGVAYARCAGAP
ncbi:hypothetical protein LNQ52_14040 [Klebsiella pneumoniae subsp. pneumoniae]|nr:hypothetical protein [Klebsiella pneumoniae subsp. pneumoniae]